MSAGEAAEAVAAGRPPRVPAEQQQGPSQLVDGERFSGLTLWKPLGKKETHAQLEQAADHEQ